MDTNKRKIVKRIVLGIVSLWVLSEVAYQFYLRSRWIENGDYKWEQYVAERNKEDLIVIRDYFKGNKKKEYYQVSYSPDLGSVDSLPEAVKNSVLNLKHDLLKGVDIFKNRQFFQLDYENSGNDTFRIGIIAGETFRQNNNGYRIGIQITNDSTLTSSDRLAIAPDIYVYRHLKGSDKREPSFILRYNCNSYDLLIMRLFW